MTTCPKCHYVRQPSDSLVHAGLCPACGIAYDKWRVQQPVEVVEFDEIPERVDSTEFYGRSLVWCGLLVWGLYFATHGVDWEIIGGSFLHNINLPFHEFGHVFFRPYGRFMTILGGSLFQVLFPLGVMLAFTFYQRDNFGASVSLWWCGQNFVDLSPYIRDGMYRALPLVGGGGEESHDWGNLLTMMNAVESAPHYGNISFAIGCVIMFLGLTWGAYILYRQYQVMK